MASQEYRLQNELKIKLAGALYYKENKEKIFNYQKRYRESHKEEIKKSKKRYYIGNREKILLKEKLYRTKNSNKIKTQLKKWRTSPEAIYCFSKRGSKKRDIPFLIEKEEFITWYNKQFKVCYYCGIPEKFSYLNSIHSKQIIRRLSIDRKNNNKGYVLDNLVLSCSLCNLVKSNIFSSYEMKELGMNFISPKWNEKLFNLQQGVGY